MKKNPPLWLVWAALAVAIAGGSLVAQDGDALARKPRLLAEALKARDEGNLQVAREKFEAILQIDVKDQGAAEGLASVKASLAAAEAAMKKPAPVVEEKPVISDKPASAEKADVSEKPGSAPVPSLSLEDVAARHRALFSEVDRAVAEARRQLSRGDYARALEIVDGASASLPNTTPAQGYRDKLALVRQEVNLAREFGDKGADAVIRDEARRLAGINADKVKKAEEQISIAESLIRKSTPQSLEEALAVLEKLEKDKVLPSDFSARPYFEKIVNLRAGALARRALLAMEAREMTKADAYVRDYEKLLGVDNPAARRLRAEYNSKKVNPTYRSVDEISPGLRAKDEKVQELLVKGRARYLYGDYQGALEAYREVLQYQPNNSESKAYQVRIRELLSENSGQWNRSVTKGKLLELLDETWKLPEVFNREASKDSGISLTDPAIEKLRGIIVPEINIRDLPLDRAIQQLNNVSQSYDKDQKGVNMVVIDPDRKNPPVNITLRNVSLEKALEFITKGVNFTFTVNQGIVEVRPDSGSSDQETEFFPLSQAATIKMTGMSSTGGAGAGAGGAAAGGANPFGGAGAGAAAAGGEARADEVAIKNFFIRSGVSFETQGSSLAYDGTNLIVTQNRKNLDRVRNILRRYSDIKQVHIETKFIEVSENALNELGANWRITNPLTGAIRAQTNLRSVNGVFGSSSTARSGSITVGSTTTPLANTPPSFPTGNTGTAEPNFGGSSPLGSVWGGVTGAYTGKVGMIGSYDLSVFLKAVEQNAGTDLMSSPSLTVLDGKTALVKIAQLLRYPQSYGDTQSNVGAGGTGTTSAGVTITAGTPQDFTVQEVGVTLEVTPTVQADDAIALNLKPKVTEFEGFVEYGGTSVAIAGNTTVLVPSGFFQPIFTTREVSTDVTVFDGATVVIAGLTREEVKTVNDKVPVLGDIPLIGAAFRSNGKTTTKRNLMVFVTANLVSPGGATLRSSHPGMRAGTTFSNPTLTSPGGAVYREPIEAGSASPVAAPPVPAAEGVK